jgi:hypothetical protein
MTILRIIASGFWQFAQKSEGLFVLNPPKGILKEFPGYVKGCGLPEV